MMNRDEILSLFREAGTLKEGHFVLTSGQHSDRFFLMSATFQQPELAERLCADLAAKFDGVEIDTVLGPATGGIVLAYEVARQIGLRRGTKAPRAIFTEKTTDGKMALRRQWSLRPGERLLVVEDAVSTGGSVFKALDAVSNFAHEVVGVGVLVDRSRGLVDFGAPIASLITEAIEAWAPEQCPLCQQGVPAVKPKA